MDTIGPLPADEFGNTYIMVAVDGFSRFVVLEPASDASGESVAMARFVLKLVPGLVRQTIELEREFGRTVDHSTTIISSMCSVIYWALIDMSLWPIGQVP